MLTYRSLCIYFDFRFCVFMGFLCVWMCLCLYVFLMVFAWFFFLFVSCSCPAYVFIKVVCILTHRHVSYMGTSSLSYWDSDTAVFKKCKWLLPLKFKGITQTGLPRTKNMNNLLVSILQYRLILASYVKF